MPKLKTKSGREVTMKRSLYFIITLAIILCSSSYVSAQVGQMITSAMAGSFVGIEPVQGKSEAIKFYNRGVELYKTGKFKQISTAGTYDTPFYNFTDAYDRDKSLLDARNALAIVIIQAPDRNEKLVKNALNDLNELADKGFEPAILNLAVLYENGTGVEQDYYSALKILQKLPSGDIDGYKYIAQIELKIEQARVKAEQDQLEAERKAEQERLILERQAKELAERAEAAKIASERRAEQERLAAEVRAKEEAIRKEEARLEADRRAKEDKERVEKLRTTLKARPVKSIDDGFRGIPWGIKKEDAIQIFGLYEHELAKMFGAKLYGREDENLSLGNIKLLSLMYAFGVDAGATEDERKGFIGAILQFDSKYFKQAIQEVTGIFGPPTLTGGLTGEWHLKNVKITMEMSFDNPAASIQILRQFPEQQKQRGGGF